MKLQFALEQKKLPSFLALNEQELFSTFPFLHPERWETDPCSYRTPLSHWHGELVTAAPQKTLDHGSAKEKNPELLMLLFYLRVLLVV